MDTWKQCGWAACNKRFKLGRQANSRVRFCSPGCRLKAHRSGLMIVSSTVPAPVAQDDRFSAPVATAAPDVAPLPQTSRQSIPPLTVATNLPPGAAELIAQIPDDLSIPPFLRRTAAA
jgi:hypothetical protein